VRAWPTSIRDALRVLEEDLELPHEAQRGLLEQQRLEAEVIDVLLQKKTIRKSTAVDVSVSQRTRK
jgi:hypothetical protein